jgi:hypothetical protein
MAEGCNLPATHRDIGQMKEARENGPTEEAKESVKKAAGNILNKFLNNNRDGLMTVLNDKTHTQHNLVQNLLVKSLGENQVNKQDENKLSGALYTVLRDHHNPQGLFKRAQVYHGPGATEMSQPYELLSSAALIQKEVTTSLGNKLKIYPTDRVDFGQKFAGDRHYLRTIKKGTIEADTLISRNSRIIGIDAKYSRKFLYEPWRKEGTPKDLNRQLKGLRNSFKDEQLHEFYFVTNGKFSDKFKNPVYEQNRLIFLDWAKEIRKSYNYENVSQSEKNELPPEYVTHRDFIRNINFADYSKEVKDVIDKYKIPQIGLCEHVNYEGY